MVDAVTMLTEIGPELDGDQSAALQRECADVVLGQAEAVVRRGIARWSAGDWAADQQVCLDVLAAMFALRSFHDTLRQRIVLHPAFRYWLQAMRRTSRGDDPDHEVEFARALVDFIWVEQALAGTLDRNWTVWTDDRGALRCPSRSRWIELGDAYAQRPVTVSAVGDAVQIACLDGLTVTVPLVDLAGQPASPQPTIEREGYAIYRAPMIADDRVEVCSREPWLRVAYTGTNQRTTGVAFFGTRDELYPSNLPSAPYAEAFQLLQDVWPQGAEDFGRFTHVIVPMRPDPDNHRAFTVSSRQGAIFVDLVDPAAMVENLIHENAHIKLRQFQLLDPLLRDPSDETRRFPVPWRPDPRPIPGIFEGVWVFAHVAEYRWRQYHRGIGEVERFRRLVDDLLAAERIIAEHGVLTEAGQQFLKRMAQWIGDLRERAGVTPVHAAAARL